MTSVLTREEFRARTSEEFRARLMALVLTAVLVWYTLVVPPYASAPSRAPRVPEDEGTDGEVRNARAESKGQELIFQISPRKPPAEAPDVPVEELDWPEYIGLD
ncbi:MAG TPA: hypothetical protein VGP08_08870 [Pyrinomonadaceae bacterium]|jgi:hypothetical protein|nr:hypothetical protein [Pyrinomonadaceae bacterium]